MKGISTIGPWVLALLALAGVGFQEWRFTQLERRLFAMREASARNPWIEIAKLIARLDRLEAERAAPPTPAPAPAAPASAAPARTAPAPAAPARTAPARTDHGF